MKKFIFVTDFLLSEVTGGAELTTDAIMAAAPEGIRENISCVKSESISPQLWLKPDIHWILGNYTRLSKESLEAFCMLAQQNKVEYSVIEFDYKYCAVRNEKVHNYQIFSTKSFGFCNCANSMLGEYTKIIFGNAKKVHFMSQEQMNLILKRIPALEASKQNFRVQWSTWSNEDLGFIEELYFKRQQNKIIEKCAIQKSSNWLKGTETAIECAKSHNFEYDLIESMEYHKFLETLSNYKGFIFTPNAYDTCPRVVVEAKLLGLNVITNDNVQITKEIQQSSREELLDNLYRYASNFWRNYQL